MICANICNNNTAGGQNQLGNPQAITTTGNYCAIIAAWPNIFDSIYYNVVAGAGVTAIVVGLQRLRAYVPGGQGGLSLSQTWDTLTTPNSMTGSAFTLINGTAPGVYCGSLNVSGSLVVPTFGIRLAVTTLTAGNISYAELLGTVR